MNIFLITFLSCSQVQAIAAKLQNIAFLSPQQKHEIIEEIKQVVPSCPVVIKK